jgi:hypothetical protein
MGDHKIFVFEIIAQSLFFIIKNNLLNKSI